MGLCLWSEDVGVPDDHFRGGLLGWWQLTFWYPEVFLELAAGHRLTQSDAEGHHHVFHL